MKIKSNLKSTRKGEEDAYSSFEQRVDKDKESYYFHQPCIEFPIIDKNKQVVVDIVEQMHDAMKGCGIGLAHNQYPKAENATNPYAIFIIEARDVPFEVFINPVIVGYTEEKVGFYHGCLSALGYESAKVATYKEVLIAFYAEDLKTLQVKKFADFASVICQHEFNHLTTKGTYVDTIYNHVNGNHELAKDFFSTDEQIKSDKRRYSLDTVSDDIPCLIPSNILSKCKKYLNENKLYNDAVDDYLISHPEDKPLYEQLSNLPDTQLPLYGEVIPHHSES
ncbi:peptide deformylase [Candidatus Tisiphia endosymbiont of Hybos culiciformis]|uniref:peptide deformylase n=1 Tax=Candidatus Tisiphia endosymbiont of Hybos culiciformis TaxID=3139331 RepID=UPI003CCB552E